MYIHSLNYVWSNGSLPRVHRGVFTRCHFLWFRKRKFENMTWKLMPSLVKTYEFFFLATMFQTYQKNVEKVNILFPKKKFCGDSQRVYRKLLLWVCIFRWIFPIFRRNVVLGLHFTGMKWQLEIFIHFWDMNDRRIIGGVFPRHKKKTFTTTLL